MLNNSHRIMAILLVASCGTLTHAGPDYKNLKECVIGCLQTTNSWTWARTWCMADCALDYGDSKLSVNPNFDPNFGATPGLEMFAGVQVLNLDGLGPLLDLEFNMPNAPGTIENVTFRALESGGDPLGVVLAIVDGPGESFFAYGVDASMFGSAGVLFAEVKYFGNPDIDDVGVISYTPAPATLALMAVGLAVGARRRRG